MSAFDWLIFFVGVAACEVVTVAAARYARHRRRTRACEACGWTECTCGVMLRMNAARLRGKK